MEHGAAFGNKYRVREFIILVGNEVRVAGIRPEVGGSEGKGDGDKEAT